MFLVVSFWLVVFRTLLVCCSFACVNERCLPLVVTKLDHSHEAGCLLLARHDDESVAKIECRRRDLSYANSRSLVATGNFFAQLSVYACLQASNSRMLAWRGDDDDDDDGAECKAELTSIGEASIGLAMAIPLRPTCSAELTFARSLAS